MISCPLCSFCDVIQAKIGKLSTLNGRVANGELSTSHLRKFQTRRPRTAAEYAGTVNGFVNLTTSFDSGIYLMGSTHI